MKMGGKGRDGSLERKVREEKVKRKVGRERP